MAKNRAPVQVAGAFRSILLLAAIGADVGNGAMWGMLDMDFEGLRAFRTSRSFDLAPARARIRGRSALITGGGGSIGAALSRALCKQGAREVIALDASEHALARLLSIATESEYRRIREVIGDVRDSHRLTNLMRQSSPDIVFHAAALKHVHLGDRHPGECILTNLVGLKNTLNAADAHGVGLFVFVSSDKAAAPVSVMGACKRLAEIYIQGRKYRPEGPRAITVRFGNVLGSQGSVVEVFDRQIRAGGPITLTHRDMQRYFMTIEEAVGLVLLATARAASGQDTSSYLLDMGAPLKILHLAQRMIEASGRDISIVETGAREGEKFDEELYDDHESLCPTGIEGLLALKSRPARVVTDADIDRLEEIARSGDNARARLSVFELLHTCLGDARPTDSVAHHSSAQSMSAPHADASAATDVRD